MAGRKQQTFEQTMDRLEEIVHLLEQGEAPLEQSMALFEEGTKLSTQLHQILQHAEQAVSMLTQNAQGEISEQPFEEGEKKSDL